MDVHIAFLEPFHSVTARIPRPKSRCSSMCAFDSFPFVILVSKVVSKVPDGPRSKQEDFF